MTLSTGGGWAAPIGYAVSSDGNDNLYQLDMATGASTRIGPVGFADVEGLTFDPFTGELYGVDDILNVLIKIDLTTGAGTVVGNLGVDVSGTMGMAFRADGRLFLADNQTSDFFEINTTTGAASLIASTGAFDIAGLAFGPNGTLYGVTDFPTRTGPTDHELVTVDPSTGAITLVGLAGVGGYPNPGIDFDAAGTLWMVNDSGQIVTIDPATGAGTLGATTVTGLEGLAI